MLTFILAGCFAITPLPEADVSDWNVQLIVYVGTPCRGVRNAYVELPMLQLIARSDRHGRIKLERVPPGRHRLVVWTARHAPVEATLTVSRHGPRIILVVDLATGQVSRLEEAPVGHRPHHSGLPLAPMEFSNVISDRRSR